MLLAVQRDHLLAAATTMCRVPSARARAACRVRAGEVLVQRVIAVVLDVHLSAGMDSARWVLGAGEDLVGGNGRAGQDSHEEELHCFRAVRCPRSKCAAQAPTQP